MGGLARRALMGAALALAAAGAGHAAVPALPGDMGLGNPKAPVTIVEYASLSCPHCAHFNADVFPGLKAKYIDTGKVYFVMREFLTPPENVAAAGWLLARCAGPGKYFPMVDGVFNSQVEWSGGDIRGSLLKVARANGMTDAQFDACLKDEAGYKALNERVQHAAQVEHVDSTPTIEINGKRAPGVPQSLAELEDDMAAATKSGGR